MDKARSSSREIAYEALKRAFRGDSFLSLTLNTWIKQEKPPEKEIKLAKRLSSGVCQRALTLEYFAKTLSPKLKVNIKEKTLLFLGLYQIAYMDKIPAFAAVSTTVSLAKRKTSPQFAAFLNRLLRQASLELPNVPKDNLSLLYSYPPFFIEKLIRQVGREKAIQIFEAGNKEASLSFRVRGERKETSESLAELIKDPSIYIQNPTPLILMEKLKGNFLPSTILDLCASPGGKLLIAHDFFPRAALFANDISEKKLIFLKENLKKYGVQATLSVCKGEEFVSDTLFDLIICDVPCSNSGVLNKRPEARWRLSEENLLAHAALQEKILRHAKTLLKPDGEIWYLTCSILKEENEDVVNKVGMQIQEASTQYPAEEGLDGGFACSLRNSLERGVLF